MDRVRIRTCWNEGESPSNSSSHTDVVSSSIRTHVSAVRAGHAVALQPGGGGGGAAASVRAVRGRGGAPVSLHQRHASLQRQVVQERQGVLQVGHSTGGYGSSQLAATLEIGQFFNRFSHFYSPFPQFFHR